MNKWPTKPMNCTNNGARSTAAIWRTGSWPNSRYTKLSVQLLFQRSTRRKEAYGEAHLRYPSLSYPPKRK